MWDEIEGLGFLVRSKHTLNTLHDTVLRRVVRVILGRNLENGGQKLLVVVQQVTDDFGNLHQGSTNKKKQNSQ